MAELPQLVNKALYVSLTENGPVYNPQLVSNCYSTLIDSVHEHSGV